MSRTELRYGLIAGVLLIGTLFLDKAWGIGPNVAGGFPSLTGYLVLIFIMVYAMREINKATPYATVKDAFLSGLSVAFLGGIIFGLYSLFYIKYFDPAFVVRFIAESKKNMPKGMTFTPQEMANRDKMILSFYSPFSQFLTGLGICVTVGAIAAAIAAWVLHKKK
jgi:hypothetical protein